VSGQAYDRVPEKGGEKHPKKKHYSGVEGGYISLIGARKGREEGSVFRIK